MASSWTSSTSSMSTSPTFDSSSSSVSLSSLVEDGSLSDSESRRFARMATGFSTLAFVSLLWTFVCVLKRWAVTLRGSRCWWDLKDDGGYRCKGLRSTKSLPPGRCKYMLARLPYPIPFPKALFGKVLCQTAKNVSFIKTQMVRHGSYDSVSTADLFSRELDFLIFWVQHVCCCVYWLYAELLVLLHWFDQCSFLCLEQQGSR